ncbi:MAG: D-glucuronyl C5-epimerase family protein, partial [Candidatus Micrarchaeaceae archaeon]
FMFSLSGLYDAWKVLGYKPAKRAFEIGISTLSHKIALYDLRFTSRYDYSPRNQVASAIGVPPDHYHELHVGQLLWLWSKTCEPVFREYASTFLSYDLGTYRAAPDLGAIARKYASISASYSIEPKDYGASNLNDATWTWGTYWSSNRFPVTVTIDLGSVVTVSGVTFVSPTADSLPSSVAIYKSDTTNHYVLTSRLEEGRRSAWTYYYKTRHYESYVRTYPVTRFKARYMKVAFYKPAMGSLLALRALDVHYDREKLLRKLVDAYGYADSARKCARE